MSQTPPDEPEQPLPPTTPPPEEPRAPGAPGAGDEPGGPLGVPGRETPGEAEGRAGSETPGGPEAAPAGGKPGRSTGIAVPVVAVGAVVVLVLILGVGAWLLGRDGDEAASPKATVRAFFQASEDQDCDRLVGLVVEESWSQQGSLTRDEAVEQCDTEMEAVPAVDANLDEVTVKSEDDDRAVVAVRFTVEGETTSTELELVKEDGDWKLVGV